MGCPRKEVKGKRIGVKCNSGTGKQNLLTKNEGLGWNRMQWDKLGSMQEICERLSHKEDIIVLRGNS